MPSLGYDYGLFLNVVSADYSFIVLFISELCALNANARVFISADFAPKLDSKS